EAELRGFLAGAQETKGHGWEKPCCSQRAGQSAALTQAGRHAVNGLRHMHVDDRALSDHKRRGKRYAAIEEASESTGEPRRLCILDDRSEDRCVEKLTIDDTPHC